MNFRISLLLASIRWMAQAKHGSKERITRTTFMGLSVSGTGTPMSDSSYGPRTLFSSLYAQFTLPTIFSPVKTDICWLTFRYPVRLPSSWAVLSDNRLSSVNEKCFPSMSCVFARLRIGHAGATSMGQGILDKYGKPSLPRCRMGCRNLKK